MIRVDVLLAGIVANKIAACLEHVSALRPWSEAVRSILFQGARRQQEPGRQLEPGRSSRDATSDVLRGLGVVTVIFFHSFIVATSPKSVTLLAIDASAFMEAFIRVLAQVSPHLPFF